MNLLPPEFPHTTFPTLDDVFTAINSFAGSQGYAMVKKRTTKNKEGVLQTVTFKCDKGGHYESRAHGKRKSAMRSCKCPFQAITRLEDDGWRFRVKNPSHNHAATPPESHPVLRRLALNELMKEMMETQSRTETTPLQIITNIQLQHDKNNPMITISDIYKRRKMIEMEEMEEMEDQTVEEVPLHRIKTSPREEERANEDVPFHRIKTLSRGKKRAHKDTIPLSREDSEDEISTPLPQPPMPKDIIRSRSSHSKSSKLTKTKRARIDASSANSSNNTAAIAEICADTVVRSAFERRSNDDNQNQELNKRVAKLEEEMAIAILEAKWDRELLQQTLDKILEALRGGKQQ